MNHIIFDLSSTAMSNQTNVAVVYEYTQWDEAGNEISPAPVYPNPYPRVVIHVGKLSDADRVFKERFPRSVVWNSWILPQAKRA